MPSTRSVELSVKKPPPMDRRRAPNLDGEEAVFARIYPDIRRFAAVIADADIDPDDLVQAALVRVLETTDMQTLDNPTAYLCRTITRQLANERRGLARRRHAVSRLAGVDTDHSSDSYPSDYDFLEAVDALDRAILYLVDVEGRSFGEAATSVGLSETAARARASRARKRLRSELGSNRRSAS